jgi:hypothetical protein
MAQQAGGAKPANTRADHDHIIVASHSHP